MTTAAHWRWWLVGSGIGIVVATVILFWPCLSNTFIPYWDDDLYLTAAKAYQPLTWQTIPKLFVTVQEYYQPLTMVTFVVERALSPENPTVAHGVSLALHALNTGLVLILAGLVTVRIPDLRRGERAAIVLLTGMVFGWHPMQVESVAWMAERKTTICAFFMLGFVCAYLQTFEVGCLERLHKRWWWVTNGFFIAAWCSKPMAVSLPIVALALDIYPLRRWETLGWRRVLTEKTVWWIMSVAMTLLTVVAQVHRDSVSTTLSIGDRLIVAVRAVIFYIWKIVWPSWLSPLYPQATSITLQDREFLLPLVVLIILAVACLWWRKQHPQWSAAGLALLALVLPISGLIQSGSQAVADRYVYLAIIPVTFGFAGLGIALWRLFSNAGRLALLAVIVLELGYFAVRTREQIPVWHDDLRLWQAAHMAYPNNWVVSFKVSMALLRREQFAQALPYAEEATAGEGGENAMAENTLGMIYLRLQRPANAQRPLERAVALEPHLRSARFNLACVYMSLSRTSDACLQVETLLRDFPQAAASVAREPIFRPLLTDPDCQQRLRQWLPNRAGGGTQ